MDLVGGVVAQAEEGAGGDLYSQRSGAEQGETPHPFPLRFHSEPGTAVSLGGFGKTGHRFLIIIGHDKPQVHATASLDIQIKSQWSLSTPVSGMEHLLQAEDLTITDGLHWGSTLSSP